MIIELRPGAPIPTNIDWAEVERVEVYERFDRETMGPLIVEALGNDVGLRALDPDVLKAIDRFLA